MKQNYDDYYEDDWDEYRKVDGKRRKGNHIQKKRKQKMIMREEFFDEQEHDNG